MSFWNSLIRHWGDFAAYSFAPYPDEKTRPWKPAFLFVTGTTTLVLIALGLFLKVVMGDLFSGAMPHRYTEIASLPIWIMGGIAVCIIPVLEELAFRLPMHRSWKNALVSALALLAVLTLFSRSAVVLLFHDQKVEPSFSVIWPCCVLFSITLGWNAYFQNPGRQAFQVYFYLLTLTFSLTHGYQNLVSWHSVPAVFVQTLPQLAGGLYYGFLRMRYGLTLSIFTHVIWNMWPTLLRLLE